MADKNRYSKIWEKVPEYKNTDFIIGEDSFLDIEIAPSGNHGFWYFKNTKKSVIKRFILEKTERTEKICKVTLIRKKEGKFTPRFQFQIFNTSNAAFERYERRERIESLIKASVNLGNCHKNFSELLAFIGNFKNVEIGDSSMAVVERRKKALFEGMSKKMAIESMKQEYGDELTDKDVDLLRGRRKRLKHFNKLLTNKDFFNKVKSGLQIKKNESVWQKFFEENVWIFGLGLQLVSCESFSERKLEESIVGQDIISGSGKRIDALLKTKGNISKILLSEIKTHETQLMSNYDRPGVFVPAEHLRGAVAQIQKTIHKATKIIQQDFLKETKPNGDPTGEELLWVKPKGIVVAGTLNEFIKEKGINYERLSSFELFRQQINGIEILTYDELLERAKYIVND